MTERRTQADRRAATRATLISAARDSLIEHGWAATTSVEVCARAGVTRGAFTHHFDSMPQLIAAALQSLYDEAPLDRRREPKDLVALIDVTWATITSVPFKAVLEAWLAMANDADLAADIGPVVAAFAARVSGEHLAPKVLTTAKRRDYYLMAREAMLGLVLGRATNKGAPLGHEAAVIRQLKSGAVGI